MVKGIKAGVTFFLFFLAIGVFGRQYTINGFVKGLPDGKVFLTLVQGDSFQLIDSTESISGNIQYQLNDESAIGLYSILFTTNASYNPLGESERSIKLIFNKEDIKFSSIKEALIDSLIFYNSTENKTFHNFLKAEDLFQNKLELLYPLLRNYPSDDSFSKSIIKRYNQLQNERDEYIEETILHNPGLFATRMIQQYRSPFLDGNKSEGELLDQLKNQFLDLLDFSDDLLLNSDILSKKGIQYLSFYRDERYSRPLQEEEFCKACDQLLQHASANEKVYQFMLEYLVRGFEAFQFDGVLAHLAEIAENKKCSLSDNDLLKQRLIGYRAMAVGQTAPPLPEIDSLIGIEKEYTLLIFWATWCPHCKIELDKLIEFMKETPLQNLQLITFSLDIDIQSWKKEIQNFPSFWINRCDTLGWDGEAATCYHVSATPTFYLLNNSGVIQAKPINFEELASDLMGL